MWSGCSFLACCPARATAYGPSTPTSSTSTARTHEITLLASTTDALGGSRHILNCGQPVTDVGYVSTLAWLYHIDVGSVGGLQQHVEAAELANRAIPKVLLKPLTQGGLGRRALAYAVLPGRSLRGAARHIHQQRPADPPLELATTEQRPSPAPAAAGPGGLSGLVRGRTSLLVVLGSAVGLLVVSLLLLLWAKTRPGFDPYGWLVWGRQTVGGDLNTNAAPSWKPLPYLFTAPYGLFGHYQLWLWMVTSLAVSLAGAVFAGRIAFRLTPRDPDRRYAAYVAAAFAALGYFGISSYWHYMLSANRTR